MHYLLQSNNNNNKINHYLFNSMINIKLNGTAFTNSKFGINEKIALVLNMTFCASADSTLSYFITGLNMVHCKPCYIFKTKQYTIRTPNLFNIL